MNHKGYYLLEVVLVLSIITSFLLLIPLVNKNSCEIKKKYFIYTLNSDIQYGLNYSMTHFALVNIRIYPDLHLYKMVDGNTIIVKTQVYEDNLLVKANLIEISHGYVNQTIYLTITCYDTIYQLTIYEKSGMIYETP